MQKTWWKPTISLKPTPTLFSSVWNLSHPKCRSRETMCLCSGNKHTDILQQHHCSLFLPVNCRGKQAVWALLFLPVLELLAQIQRKFTTATLSSPWAVEVSKLLGYGGCRGLANRLECSAMADPTLTGRSNFAVTLMTTSTTSSQEDGFLRTKRLDGPTTGRSGDVADRLTKRLGGPTASDKASWLPRRLDGCTAAPRGFVCKRNRVGTWGVHRNQDTSAKTGTNAQEGEDWQVSELAKSGERETRDFNKFILPSEEASLLETCFESC
jgi:hypothetical protein